jgi:ABC-2 type transport system ATP-binding protein
VHRLIIHASRDEGHTVFLCTHNLVEAQRLCHRVAVLEHGKVLALGTPAELGRRYAHAQRLEIEVSPQTLQAALDELGRMPGIHDVATENGIVQFSGIGHDAIPELIAQLVAARVRLHRVTPLEPTLEDVYFALHGGGEPVVKEVTA